MPKYIDMATERDTAANVYKSKSKKIEPALERNKALKTNHAPPPETYPMGGSRNRVVKRGLDS